MATQVGTSTSEILYGTSSPDHLYGNGGDDTLFGYGGSDYLDGGTGADSMIGGLGDDSYIIDNIGDIVVENVGEGVDTVFSSLDVDLTSAAHGGDLANVENLTLTGPAAVYGIGNSLDNFIIGSGWANFLDGGAGNDTIKGTGGNNIILGGLGTDSLLGGSGNDCLIGGIGADSMAGGAGNDTYYVDDTGDVVTELVNQGTDIIFSSVDYTNPINVEALVLTGSEDLNATGDTNWNDSLVGNEGNNILIGLGGSDTLMGGEIIKRTNGYEDTLGGNDTLLGGDGNDSLIGGPGIDSLIGGLGNDTYEIGYDFRYTVTSTGELYTLTTDQVINGDYVWQYNPTDSILSTLWEVTDQTNLGNAAGYTDTNRPGATPRTVVTNDVERFALTTSQVINGAYVYQYDQADPSLSVLWQVTDQTNLNNPSGYTATGKTGPTALFSTDVIVEGPDPVADGIDLVRSSATFALPTNVENLTLIGSDNVSGYGNAQDNVLTGNIGHNSLFGGDGNDTLDGAAGNDTLVGGAGNDYYILNSETEDTTIELPGGGIDTVQTSANLSLLSRPTFSQIENLVLTGSAILGKGNTRGNVITGNAQDNQLSGLGGNDTIFGGLGSDLLDGGIDDDVLIGGNNTIFGGTDTDTGNDQLIGGDGNDSLDGGRGNDILKGGRGMDFLLGGTGNDLLLGGTNGFPGQTDRDDTLGGAANDTLVGGEGNDTLDGGNGTNSLLGGLGDDLVYVHSSADIAIELPGEGYDTLMADFNLDISASGKYANFEAVALSGSTNLDLTGNDATNVLFGNNGANVIQGNAGNDTLYGGAGLDYLWGDDPLFTVTGNDWLDGGTSASPTLGDTMEGGWGNDTYVVDNVNDRVRESQPVDYGGIDTVLTSVNFDPLPANDPNNVTRAPSFANLDFQSFVRLENFVLLDDTLRGTGTAIRGVGNALGNDFIGNAENNVILGLGGDDTIIGNDGNDSLYGDRYDETPVYDPKTGMYPSNPGAYDVSNLSLADQIALIGIGSTVDGFDSLVGGAGDDLLDGNGGDDTLIGGSGNDCLVGGAGADSMVGGIGNDAYYVDSEEDVVVENFNEGTDQILSTIDIYRLQDNVENLTIYGAARLGIGNDADNHISVSQVGTEGVDPWVFGVTLDGGAGNDTLEGFYFSPEGAKDRDAADYLTGGSGDDYLDGGLGADILEGGLGNDTLVVDNPGDAMREYGYSGNPDVGGTDLVISSIDLDLSDTDVDGGMFIENLTMSKGGLTGAGNRLNNVITGYEKGDDILFGGFGNDTIYGGAIGYDPTKSNGNDIIDGGDGDDFLRAGNNTSLSNTEIDEITGGAGKNVFSLVNEAGKGFYRNMTGGGVGADDFGDSSYVILNDAGGLILENNPNITWKDAGDTPTTTAGYYVAKDFGGGFGIFVSSAPGGGGLPDINDDLIATGPAFTTLATAQAAIDSATYI